MALEEQDKRKTPGWNNNNPGDNPVCIVGAGFQRAILDPPRPSTIDFIALLIEKLGILLIPQAHAEENPCAGE